MLAPYLCIFIFLLGGNVESKVFDECELARVLKANKMDRLKISGALQTTTKPTIADCESY